MKTPSTSGLAPAGMAKTFIERLEPRIAPANVVSTVLTGGTLTITTVDQFSEAAVQAFENNQSLQLVGTGMGNVTVQGAGNTTVDGLASKSFVGVTNIVLTLKLGTDQISTSNIEIAGDLTFNGGQGGSIFNLDTTGGVVTKVRNLSVTNLEGADNFAITGPIMIGGNLRINNGSGGSNTNIGFELTDDVTIQGSVTVINGDGTDIVNLFGDDFVVNGPITISNGNGDSSSIIAADSSMVIAKPLKVTNGAGNDSFNIAGASLTTSFGGITISNGNGNSSISFGSSVSDTINGNLIITNGAGNDTLTLNSGAFSVTGTMRIANGTGDATTDLSPTNTNTVTGGLFLTNGAGDHSITISAGSTVNYKSVSIGNGAGDSTVQITGSSLTFGSLAVTNGDGFDSFAVNASNNFAITTGGLAIRNGTGGSSTTLTATNTASIQGALQITNGDGDDSILIGSGGGDFGGLHAVSITNGAGAGSTVFNPTNLTISSSLKVSGADGSDSLRLGTGALATFSISQGVTFTPGLGGVTFGANPTNAGSIGGALNVTTFDSVSTVELRRTTIVGATTIVGGNGSEQIRIDNSVLAGLMIRTGGGFDLVAIEDNSNDGISTTLNGPVTIDLGSADDRIDYGRDLDDRVNAIKAVKFIGGSDLDTFDQTSAANQFQIAPVFTGFEVNLP